MILESELETKLKIHLSSLDELQKTQVICSRETSQDGELVTEKKDVECVIAVVTSFRQHDSFSLPMVSIPITIQVGTRTELDPQGIRHEAIIEAIATLLSRWHKEPERASNDLDGQRYMVGELRMDGGSGRTYDKTNSIWSESITFTIRGSERF